MFVVASARERFNPSEVLFEFSGERRDTAPSRKTGQGITADAQTGVVTGGGIPEVAGTLMARDKKGVNTFDMEEGKYAICFEPRSPDGHARVVGDIAPFLNTMGGGQREPCVTYGIQGNMIGRADTAGPQGNGFSEEMGYTLTTGDVHGVAVPYQDVVGALCARDYKGVGNQYVGEDKVIATQYAVRRLTPIECERLQGFPDGYTNIPWRNKPEAPDGPRYKALGNSWAVPVVRWIGERINNQQGNTNE